MDDTEFHRLKRAVAEHMPTKPFYVCTINKSNIVKGKAKMVKLCFLYKSGDIHILLLEGMTYELFDVIYTQYISRSFTIHHIVPNVALPAFIPVYYKKTQNVKVKIVLSESKVNGKLTGGAMLRTNWMEVVKKRDMRVGDIYVFYFEGNRDGLKLRVDRL